MNKMLSNGKTIADLVLEIKGIKTTEHVLYRVINLGKSENVCTKDRIFHIPFSKRHLVTKQRFSINGFPCLYLGDSIKICLDEVGVDLNFPNLSKVYISQFQSKKTLNLLMLFTIQDIYKLKCNNNKDLENNYRRMLNFTLTYPLALACLVKVKEQTGDFKPEYIIPQMLLQYVKSDSRKLDGIAYPSTKMNYNEFSEISTYNIVLPPRNWGNEDFCQDLKGNFHVSEPQKMDTLLENQNQYNNQEYKNSIYEAIENKLK
jgi:hypothetical protein